MRGERSLARVVDLVPQSDVVVEDDADGQGQLTDLKEVVEEPQVRSFVDQTSTGVSYHEKPEEDRLEESEDEEAGPAGPEHHEGEADGVTWLQSSK